MSRSRGRVARFLSCLPVLFACTAPSRGAAGAEGGPEPVRVDAHGRGARIEGRVVDGTGAGVASAHVEAYAWADVLGTRGSFVFGWSSPLPPALASESTDAEGRFALADVPPGMTVLVVETPVGERWGGLATAVAERPVPVLARVDPAGTRLRGVVTDEGGAPIADAPVVTLPPVLPVGGASILAQFTWSVRTRTDAQGGFEAGLPGRGPTGVAVQRPVDGRWVVVEWKPAADGPSPPLRVAFAPGAPLAARIEGARSGRPLAGAGVIVVARNPDAGSLTLQSGIADPSGSLRLASFPPLGTGGFAVLAAGIGGDWREADGSSDVRVPVRLGATLSGHVRTADGRPVVGARVLAHAWDWPALEATTDAEGAYEIRGLPRTRPYLATPTHEANGHGLAFVDVRGFATEAGTGLLAYRPEQERVTQDFVLHAGATVRGRGEPSDAGGPLTWTPGDWQPNADLMVVRGTTIGEDGSFVLTDLPPGRVTLSFPRERRVVVDGLRAGETREGVQGPPSR